MFSGPGSLAERSRSAVRAFARCWAFAVTPTSAAVASVEPTPNIFLLDKPPLRKSTWFSLLTAVLLVIEADHTDRSNSRPRPESHLFHVIFSTRGGGRVTNSSGE